MFKCVQNMFVSNKKHLDAAYRGNMRVYTTKRNNISVVAKLNVPRKCGKWAVSG